VEFDFETVNVTSSISLVADWLLFSKIEEGTLTVHVNNTLTLFVSFEMLTSFTFTQFARSAIINDLSAYTTAMNNLLSGNDLLVSEAGLFLENDLVIVVYTLDQDGNRVIQNNFNKNKLWSGFLWADVEGSLERVTGTGPEMEGSVYTNSGLVLDAGVRYETSRRDMFRAGTPNEWFVSVFFIVDGQVIIHSAEGTGNRPAQMVNVSFETHGGTEVETQSLVWSNNATRPEKPTRPGFTFNGWLLDGVEFDFETVNVTSSITLVADWLLAPIDFNLLLGNSFIVPFGIPGVGHEISDCGTSIRLLPLDLVTNYDGRPNQTGLSFTPRMNINEVETNLFDQATSLSFNLSATLNNGDFFAYVISLRTNDNNDYSESITIGFFRDYDGILWAGSPHLLYGENSAGSGSQGLALDHMQNPVMIDDINEIIFSFNEDSTGATIHVGEVLVRNVTFTNENTSRIRTLWMNTSTNVELKLSNLVIR